MSCFSGDKMEYEEIIGDDLKKRAISYIKLDTSEAYLRALISYLKKRGYGYIVNEIEKIAENKHESSTEEILKLLIDVNLIDKPKININNSFAKTPKLIYRQAKGLELRREITITSYNYPLKIVYVTARNKEIVKLSYTENSVIVDIVIPGGAEKTYKVSEDIVIVTNYSAEKIHFTIEAEAEGFKNKTKVIAEVTDNNSESADKWLQTSRGEDALEIAVALSDNKEKPPSQKAFKKKKTKKRKKKNSPINSVKKEFEKLRDIFFKPKKKK